MNSDSLDQVWQNQPVPPAQAYRKLQDRSWELRQKVDRFDARHLMAVIGIGWMSIGGVGLLSDRLDLAHLLFLVAGIGALGWVLWSGRQRSRLRQSGGDTLVREIELGLLRMQQNQALNRWLSWIVPPLMVAVGVWIFWPQKHGYRATTSNDWIWSGSFMALWTAFAVWSAWSGRKRRRKMDELRVTLTELRASLLALGNSGVGH